MRSQKDATFRDKTSGFFRLTIQFATVAALAVALVGCTVCTVERDAGGRVFRIRNGRAVLDEHGMVREIESKGIFEVKVDKISIEK